ncbi:MULTISPECIES: hypothetical protein [unclassified Roseateles]|uniref:hypothetical protein n=1 Tax=unclassified Roseateles TaxID=2626991 RepID=UPI0006F98087|nr:MULTISPECIES: hypothetical protein [unclassified Roseateles]KQW43363.1 hypothetical protein ASC81_16390 [Pelomonas sp. Root405]KRA71101.1 hypothetical protein ASD88_14910 [Pelomonas sp. Root662]
MLNTTPNLADPFAMLISPEQVMNAIGRSDRLARLQSRIYRPLDRPWIPVKGTVDFDSEIDAEPEIDLSDLSDSDE